jgi:threonyl-tRNA synthetase
VAAALSAETGSLPPGVIAARVNGELRDLAYQVTDGDVVEEVDNASDDGRYIVRHSAAHVMAQAVQDLFPQAKLGIGPPVENGFYYDFDVEAPFTPQDLKAIEGRMRQIVKQGQRFSRRVVTDEQAAEELGGRNRADHLRQPGPGQRRAVLEGSVPRSARPDHQEHPGLQADAHRRCLLAGE